jgi:hypothetical protein
VLQLRRFIPGCGFLIGSIWICACGPEPVTFTYEAPVGRQFVLEEKLTETTDATTAGRAEVQFTGKSRVRVERESAWRVHWIETIESASMYLVRQQRRFDLGDIIGGYEIRTDFSDSGEAVAIEGLGAVSSAVLRHLQERGLVADPSAVAPAPSGDEALSVWNERIYALAGLRLRPGESAEATGRQELGGDLALDYRVTMTLGDEVDCPGESKRRCVKLALEYSTSDEDAEAVRGQRLDDLSYDLTTVIERAEMTGTGERVLDPATLLVYDEKREPVLRVTGTSQGDRFSLTLKQSHTWKLRPAS